MSIIKRVIIFFVLLITPATTLAQEMLGTALGNYSGLDAISLNPSALHNSKSYLDIQLFGLDGFLQNNYLYMSTDEYRFTNFFKPDYQWPTHPEEYGTEERIFYHYTNQKDKNAFINTRINGPGAMVVWDHHAFALSTAFRTVGSFVNIPYELANFMYLGLNYLPQQDINYVDQGRINGSGMSWVEIAASYSNTFHARGFNTVSAGISVKRLMGLGGIYINTEQIDYIVPDDSTLDVRNLNAEMGMAIPVDYNTNTALTSPLFKGGGFGVDLGVTYTRLMHYHQDQNIQSLCEQKYEEYRYRVGVALIDIGAIRFNENATKMRIDNRSAYWSDVNSMNIGTIQQFLDTISYQFYGNYTEAFVGNAFTMWLPSALSVQFDYHLRRNLYVNAGLIYGFPISGSSVTRPAELFVTPRYETRWFEMSMPVSLYNWQLARVGLAVRIYGLTIGTDKIGGYFHYTDFTGLDFYMSLKFFFEKGDCRNKGPVHCGGNERFKIKF
jgi:hypothetical protein